MARKLQNVFRDAAELPERDRAELAGMLIETLEDSPDEDVEAAWEVEVAWRIRQLEAGEVTTILWEQARAELHARVNAKG